MDDKTKDIDTGTLPEAVAAPETVIEEDDDDFRFPYCTVEAALIGTHLDNTKNR